MLLLVIKSGSVIEILPEMYEYRGRKLMEENNLQQCEMPVVSEKPPKSGKGVVIAIIAAAVILFFVLGGILLYKLVFRSPEARLIKGFANMEEEMSAYAVPVLGKIDYAAMAERMQIEPSAFDMSINITVPQDNIFTMGYDLGMVYDYTEERCEADVALSIYNIDLLKAELMVAGDKLYVTPGWTEGTYLINLDTVGRDYNASEWAWLFDYDLPEDFSYDFFANPEEQNETVGFNEETNQIIKESLAYIRATMVVEDSKDTLEIERDGKTVKCNGVRVVLDKDALNQAIEEIGEAVKNSDYMQEQIERMQAEYSGSMEAEEVEKMYDDLLDVFFSARFKNDAELFFYLDKQDRIVSIVTEDEIKFKASELKAIEMNLVFSGKERALDEVSGVVTIETKNTAVDMSVEREAELTQDTYANDFKLYVENKESSFGLDFLYACDWDMEEDDFTYEFLMGDGCDSYAVTVKGGFSDIVQGESFNLELGEFSISENDETILTIFGSMKLEPFTGTFTEPSDATDFFGMSEEEMIAAMEEMGTALYDFLYQMY